ncbi:MAG: riboflavin biosynthesis protein RibF [Proteobacteria bacterium]|nr:riboflavin biosynthesis protein RibF [Pseudomonadota bacterium]
MKVFNLNPVSTKDSNGLTISIGVFDGIHLGHQKILKKLIKSCPCGIITFYRHPRSGVKLLQPFCERLRIFREMGINKIFIVSKRDNLFSLSAEQFVIKVIEPLNIKRIVVGTDFRLGHNRDTDVDKFEKICSERDILVDKIDIVLEGHDKKLSSTQIREKILAGDVKEANSMLDRPFAIKGFVVRGAGLGARLGFSTANIIPHPTKQVVPANGVYRTQTIIRDKRYNSITYVGTNPTLRHGKYYSIETHIPGFSDDLHGKVIEVEFLNRTRDEIKFKSVNELIDAIKKDIVTNF